MRKIQASILLSLFLSTLLPAQTNIRVGKLNNSIVFADACGLKGDNVTDDAPAFLACINANPGRHFILTKTTQSPAAMDYFFGSAITLNGNGMTVEGTGGGYAGGVSVRFPAGTKGFIVNNATCQGCAIGNLNIYGASPFTTTDKHQCVIPSTMEGANGAVTGTSTDDGIQVGGNFTRLYNLYITGWGRHGVYFAGGDIAGTFADDVSVHNVISYGNRGNGFYGHGGDFNAGHSSEAIAYNNQFWGIHDSGFLGNTWAQPQVTGNHQDNAGAAGSTTAVNISRSASVVTVSNFTAHGLVVGNAIVISGASDATYNGSWFVASVVNANTITFSNASGATSGVTANVRIATCTEAWTASGLDGGSYKSVGAAQQGTWINPYAELSNGGSAKFAGGNVVLGGDLTFDTSQQNYHYTGSGFHGSSYSFTANDANHPNVQILFQPIQTSGSTLWSFIDGVGGTEDYRLTAGPGSWQLQDQRSFGAGFRMFSGGIAQVDGGGGSVRLNSFSGVNVQFGNGAGVFPFTENQNGTLVQAPLANGLDHFTSTRFTDTAPTGNFENFKSTAGSPLWQVDITGKLITGTMDAARITSGALGKPQQTATTMYTDQANTITSGKLSTVASTTGGAGFNIPAGVAPTSPAIGDHWMLGANLFYRDNSGSPATQTVEIQSNKNAANGYAGVDAGSHLAAAQLPALTGDVTSSAGSNSVTVTGVNGTAVSGSVGNLVKIGSGNTLVQDQPANLMVEVQGIFDQTAKTALIGTTNIVTNAPAGMYRIEPYIRSTVACATPGPAAATVTFGWTDEVGAVTNSQVTLALGTTTAMTTSLTNNLSPIFVGSTSNITASVAYTACTSGTATYNIHVRVISYRQ